MLSILKKYNEEKKNFDTEDFYVNKEIYDGVSIGDYFIFNEDMGSTDEPYTKTKKEE